MTEGWVHWMGGCFYMKRSGVASVMPSEAAGGPPRFIALHRPAADRLVGWSLRPGALAFAPLEGAEQTAPLTAATPYLQEPYVVAPFAPTVDAYEGPRLTGFFRADEAGFDLDFRVTTRDELRAVALAGTLECHAPIEQEDLGRLLRGKANPSRGISVWKLPEGAWLFLDVGEHGEADGRAAPSGSLSLSFFRQSLERGVILVGRSALRTPADREALAVAVTDWLDKPQASL
ncbi:MAG TPA: hypothetical protein VNC50_04305 [Planctomycetia bacterium]|nr:hypothetical protein [Planctomycetia bacterium]